MNTITETPRKKRSKNWLIALACVILLSGLVYLNFDRVYLTYRYIFQTYHFSSGDPVYLKKDFSSVPLSRMIRPLTEADVDAMDIADDEKAKLKLKLNPSLKPYLF